MTQMEEPTVFIIDDDAAVRDSIQELVESVGLLAKAFASAQAFLDFYRAGLSGCLVLDVRMAGMSGLALQRKLSDLGVEIPLIFITGHSDVPMAVRALKAGAVDFIQKPYREQRLLDSINDALAADADARNSAAGTNELAQQLASLTDREREVLNRILDGDTSKQAARNMGISPRTVEAHRQNLLRKLNISSVKELMLHPLLRK